MDGTYVNKYEYQNERGGPFTENAGRYADATPVFRWRHNADAGVDHGRDWTVSLANRYNSHYVDQNDVAAPSSSAASSTTRPGPCRAPTRPTRSSISRPASRTCSTQDPPYTNQSTTFQQGYDPRYTDPLGATVSCARRTSSKTRVRSGAPWRARRRVLPTGQWASPIIAAAIAARAHLTLTSVMRIQKNSPDARAVSFVTALRLRVPLTPCRPPSRRRSARSAGRRRPARSGLPCRTRPRPNRGACRCRSSTPGSARPGRCRSGWRP